MKNLPNRIYLNLGELTDEELRDCDFDELDEVTWSQDDVQGENVAYIREDRDSKPYDMTITGKAGNYKLQDCRKSCITPLLEEQLQTLSEMIGDIKSVTIKFK